MKASAAECGCGFTLAGCGAQIGQGEQWRVGKQRSGSQGAERSGGVLVRGNELKG